MNIYHFRVLLQFILGDQLVYLFFQFLFALWRLIFSMIVFVYQLIQFVQVVVFINLYFKNPMRSVIETKECRKVKHTKIDDIHKTTCVYDEFVCKLPNNCN